MKDKSIYPTAVFCVVLLWALWNYQVSLELLSGFLNVVKPFIIGASIAFIVNVLLEKVEFFWCGLFQRHNRVAGCLQRPFNQFSSDWCGNCFRPFAGCP